MPGYMCRPRRFLYIFRFFVLMLMGGVTATLFIRTEINPTSVAAGNLYFGAPPPRPSRTALPKQPASVKLLTEQQAGKMVTRPYTHI